MKTAKVASGIVRHVWPYYKNGIIKELPHHYRGLNGKPVPDCIVEVSDDVQPGWHWDVMAQRYVPHAKIIREKRRSDLVEVIAEKLGVSYDDLMGEINRRKKARRNAAAKAD